MDSFKQARKREPGKSMLLLKQGNKLEKQMMLKIVYYQGLNMALIFSLINNAAINPDRYQ